MWLCVCVFSGVIDTGGAVFHIVVAFPSECFKSGQRTGMEVLDRHISLDM